MYCPCHTVSASDVYKRQGDILVGFSDGLMEAFNTMDEQFGIERLSAIVRGNSGATAAEILQKVLESLNTFSGDRERHDDTTLLIVRFV